MNLLNRSRIRWIKCTKFHMTCASLQLRWKIHIHSLSVVILLFLYSSPMNCRTSYETYATEATQPFSVSINLHVQLLIYLYTYHEKETMYCQHHVKNTIVLLLSIFVKRQKNNNQSKCKHLAAKQCMSIKKCPVFASLSFSDYLSMR